jgi:predicted permease
MLLIFSKVLVAAPAMTMLIIMPIPADPVVKLTVLLGMCFPSAVIGVAVSAQENKNSQLMAEAVAVSTLLSVITLPVWIMIISRLYL